MLNHMRVPLPCIPEYLDPSQDSQLTKLYLEISDVEPDVISKYSNKHQQLFGRRCTPSTPFVQYHSLCAWLPHARYSHNLYLALCNKHLFSCA